MDANGTLDPTFGTGGVAGMPTIFVMDATPQVAASGEIYLGGHDTTGDAVIVAMLANGSIDRRFGAGGAQFFTYGDVAGAVDHLAPAPDGSLVVSFHSAQGARALARLINFGRQFDPSFSFNGDIGLPNGHIASLVVASDNAVIFSTLDTALGQATVTRLNSNGSIDPTFGHGVRNLVVGAPVIGTPVIGTPVVGTPVVGTPVVGTPVVGTPVMGTPVVGTPVVGTPVIGTPVEGIPVPGVPVDGMQISTPANRPLVMALGPVADVTLRSDGTLLLSTQVRVTGTDLPQWAAYSFLADGTANLDFGVSGRQVFSVRDPGFDQLVIASDRAFVLTRQPGDVEVFRLSSHTEQDGFIIRIFIDLLDRPPETAALSFWQGQMDGGMSGQQVAQAVMDSTEYRTQQIEDVYEKVLGRGADAAGLNAWLGYLGAGHTVEDIKSAFYGSQEFMMAHGGTDAGAIDAFYQVVSGAGCGAGGYGFLDEQSGGRRDAWAGGGGDWDAVGRGSGERGEPGVRGGAGADAGCGRDEFLDEPGAGGAVGG